MNDLPQSADPAITPAEPTTAGASPFPAKDCSALTLFVSPTRIETMLTTDGPMAYESISQYRWKDLTPAQREFLDSVSQAGGLAKAVTSLEEVRQLLGDAAP